MFVSKTIQFHSRDYEVFGDDADHYFMTCPSPFVEHDSFFEILRKIRCSPVNVFDIGASIGLFALGAFTEFPNAVVHAYEPHPEAFLALEKNAVLADGKIIPHRIALADATGTVTLHQGGPVNSMRSSGSHIMNESHWKCQDMGLQVDCSTVDAQVTSLDLESLDAIKIDVEGFELDVLEGAKETIAKFDPIIFLEFNSWALMALKNMNPRMFLDYVRDEFSVVCRVNQDKTLTRLKGRDDFMLFLHNNLLFRGCVDDLVVCKHHDPFIRLSPECFVELNVQGCTNRIEDGTSWDKTVNRRSGPLSRLFRKIRG